MDMFLDSAIKEYIRTNGSYCVVCSSENIEHGSKDYDEDIILWDARCYFCGATWTEIFKLSDVRDIILDNDKIYKAICDLIEDATEGQKTWWNYITDIETNDIREEGKEAALELLRDMVEDHGA